MNFNNKNATDIDFSVKIKAKSIRNLQVIDFTTNIRDYFILLFLKLH